jgi:hypothetical protein
MKKEYQNLINNVDKEQIYLHIKNLEGPRCPLDNMDKLNETAEYIRKKLSEYGAKVITHEFTVDGFSGTFQNIEAHIGDKTRPALIISSHYDTVEFCPGANDNLSGVASCLEITRTLAQMTSPPHLITIFFTLEEKHPGLDLKLREAAWRYGIKNKEFQFTKVKYIEQNQQMTRMMRTSRSKGGTLADGIQKFIKIYEDSMNNDELNYYNEIYEIYRPFTNETYSGNLFLIGSSRWVEDAIKTDMVIKGVINIDTVGIIKQRRFTQSLPWIPRIMLRLNKTNFFKKIGNFTLVSADKNSKLLFKEFIRKAKENSIELPFVGLRLPFTYPNIAKFLPDLLRADHAPFWRYNIPAIFLTDTAELRWDGYHTKSDEAKYLNYEQISTICKATIATIIDIQE